MQTVATIVLWAGTAATLGWAGLKARREASVLPVVLVVAVAVGSILEPIYDITFHLLWYTGGFINGDITGHQWTLFTAFGLPQPVWVMPAYVMVFGVPALIMYDRLATNPSATTIAKMAGTLFLTTAAFETIAINVSLYGYYGEAPLRLMRYPLWIAVMESAQITGFAILCAVLKRRKTSELHCLALFALFPANFAFDVLGAGFPALIAMNVAHPSRPVMWLSAFASMALAATALWWTAQLLLRESSLSPVAIPQSNFTVRPGVDRQPSAARSPETA
ncbi:MAG: hypothetical protein ACRDTS_05560 [Mycobacterium sp.]